MLIRFKKRFEKIAMGLLSFMPDVKEVKVLQNIIKEYEENDTWQLFLWKEDEDVLGTIGVTVDHEQKQITVQHISVDPSHRNLGIGTQMVKALSNFYDESYVMKPSEQTERFLDKCNDTDDE